MRPDTRWPTLGYETTPWEPLDGGSRQDRRRDRYRSAVVPAIADLNPVLSTEAAALLEEASVEIARFDAEMGGEIAPFGAVLLRSESAASSEIEHLTASATAIALAELGNTSRRNAAEIVRNSRAMQAAIELSDRLDGHSILAVHQALMGDSDPRVPGGRWRTEPVWVGGRTPHTALFVPPRHEHLAVGIADLTEFMARNDIQVLVQAALAHAQFETLHPFPDGNGRTGRAMVHAILRAKGLTRKVTIPVSAGLLTAPDEYFDALTAYRAGDIEPICRRFADASFRSLDNGRTLVADLRRIREGWAQLIQPRQGSAGHRILTELAARPVLDIAHAHKDLGISRSAAQRAFADLEAAGVVTEFSGMRRNRCWRSDEVLASLDAFAARAGRRTSPF